MVLNINSSLYKLHIPYLVKGDINTYLKELLKGLKEIVHINLLIEALPVVNAIYHHHLLLERQEHVILFCLLHNAKV